MVLGGLYDYVENSRSYGKRKQGIVVDCRDEITGGVGAECTLCAATGTVVARDVFKYAWQREGAVAP